MDGQWVLRREEPNRRFYKNLNEIRAYLGMPPIDHLGDSIGSGSTKIVDQGGQEEENNYGGRPAEVEALITQDSQSGQEYEASTISKIQMESPIIPDSTEIIYREEIEGQPFDFVEYFPEFRTDESQVFRQVEKIAIPTVEVEAPVVQDSPRIVDWEFKVLSEGVLGDVKAKLVGDNAVESRQTKEIPITVKEMNQQINIPEVLLADGWKERSNSENEANIDEHQIQPNFFEVNLNPCKVMVYDSAVEGLKKLLVLLIEWMEIRLANERTVSKTEIRVDVGKLFEEMPNMKLVLFGSTIELNKFSFQQLLEFSTLASNGRGGAAKFFLNWPNRSSMLIPYDRGKGVLSFCCWKGWSDPCIGVAYIKTLIFDPGGIYSLIVSKSSKFWSDGMIKVDRALGKKFVFDPGGVLVDHMHPQVISGNGYMGDANLATSSLCGCSCGLCSTGSYIVGWPCAVMDCEMVMVEHTTSHALFDQSGSHLAVVCESRTKILVSSLWG